MKLRFTWPKPKKELMGTFVKGVVYRQDFGPMNQEKFFDDFIDWIESQGYYFGGVMTNTDVNKDEVE